MKIYQLMSSPALVCGAGDSLNRAAQLMWEKDCGAVIVVGEDHKPVGIVTDRDVCMAAYSQGRTLSEIAVSTAMAKKVFSCRATQSIEEAERLMSDKQVRRVPVVDDSGRPVGVISLADISTRLPRGANSDEQHELLRTMAAICTPRESRRADPARQLS